MEERTVFQPRPLGSVKPGTRLNGIYEIEKMIAQGGMGEVYRGFNIQTADIVAIKMIRPEFSTNEEVMELFRREASILHNLVHEAIVRYFLFSVDPGIGRAYLAMEFVDGLPLSDRLTSGPLPLPEVAILRKRIASALETAHRLGIVHRDISSDNVILPNGDVRNAKIIDFGIARAAQAGKKTIIGSGFAGKYNYVSPEQLGLAGGDVTFKSDIYSLGLVLAEAARGHALDMSGSQAEVIDKRRVVPDLSDIDPTIRPLLQAMLQPLPADRPASMAAVAEWTEPEPVAPAPTGRRRATERGPAPATPPASTSVARESSGGRVAAIVGAIIAVVSLGGVAFVFKDDIFPHAANGPSASGALPSLPPLPAKPAAEAPNPAPGAPSAGAGLPPLGAPQAQTAPTPSPPPTSPPSPPSPSSPPGTETQETASQTPAKPTAAPQAPAPPTASNPAQHVPTADELAEAVPPRAPQPAIDLPAATVGTAYRAELPGFTDHGGKTLRLSAESVPEGLTFRDLGDGKGVLEGAPAHAGRTTIRLEAVNRAGRSAEMVATLVVVDRPQPTPAEKPPAPAPVAQPPEQARRPEAPRPSLPVATLEPATAGQDYSADLPSFLSGAGAAPMTLRADPAPPAGLAFADLGSGYSQIAGKPTRAGAYVFDVVATNAAGLSGRMSVKLNVAPAVAAKVVAKAEAPQKPPEAPRPSLPVATLEPATAGQDYSADLPSFLSGAGAAPMTLRADPAPPAGLAFADLGSGYSQIAGKPTRAGAYVFDVVATNAAGLSGRMSVKLNVAPAVAAKVVAKAEAPQKPPEAPPAVDRAAQFVQGFDGGACFLVQALPGAGHAYLGVGDTLGPFERFEESFRKEVGAEPQLSLRLIVPPQCAALDVLRAAPGEASGAPRVTLADYRVGRNKPLSGTVANLDGRRLYVLLVDNQGKVYRVEAKLQPGGDRAAFSVPLVPDPGSIGPIQLVLAVTSAKPIPSLEAFRSGELKGIAPALAEEARNGAATVGADFFMFVN